MNKCKHSKNINCTAALCERCGFDPVEAARRKAWIKSGQLHRPLLGQCRQLRLGKLWEAAGLWRAGE